MKVSELRKKLAEYPDDMEILVPRYSDYCLADAFDAFNIRKTAGVDKDGWVMRSHPTMSPENKAKEKEYLLLEL